MKRWRYIAYKILNVRYQSHDIYGTLVSHQCMWKFEIPRWRELNWAITQLTFTCSKSTIETIEKGVKHVQSYQLTLYFTSFSSVSIADFEQTNISWELLQAAQSSIYAKKSRDLIFLYYNSTSVSISTIIWWKVITS